MNELEGLNSKVHLCQKCEYSKKYGSPVKGYGNYQSKLMFVFEKPNGEACLLDEPFDPKTKSFLKKFLDINEVYSTCLLKCPCSTVPSRRNTRICIGEFLFKENKLLNPSIIVTFGKLAAQNFLNAGKNNLDFSPYSSYNLTDGPVVFTFPAIGSILNGDKSGLLEFEDRLRGILESVY